VSAWLLGGHSDPNVREVVRLDWIGGGSPLWRLPHMTRGDAKAARPASLPACLRAGIFRRFVRTRRIKEEEFG